MSRKLKKEAKRMTTARRLLDGPGYHDRPPKGRMLTFVIKIMRLRKFAPL